ncbi:hypothetical protein IFR05_000045 [Cadophora sp. M221]|nr:hypothetical protein IFR05_000045 [Cadophora sp. M221]
MPPLLPPLGRVDFDSQLPSSSPASASENKLIPDDTNHVSVGDEVDQLGSTDNDENAEHLAVDAQDSNPSLIPDSQYVPLKIDAQAETQAETQEFGPSAIPVANPAAGQAASKITDEAPGNVEDLNFDTFINSDAYDEPPARSASVVQMENLAIESSRPMGFIERPVINDAAEPGSGFKFRPPSKPPVLRPPPRIPQNVFEAKISATTTLTAAFEPERQLESAMPQPISKGLPFKSNNETASFLPLTQNTATPMTQVSAHLPAHRVVLGDEAQDATSSSLGSKEDQSRRRQKGHSQDGKPSCMLSNGADAAGHNGATRNILSPPLLHSDPDDELISQQLQSVLNAKDLTSPRWNDMQADRRDSGQQQTHPHRSLRCKGRLSTLPFPEASERPVPPQDITTVHQQELNRSPKLQGDDTTTASFSGEVPNEKRTRPLGSGIRQAHRDSKDSQHALDSSLAARSRAVPAQAIGQPGESVQSNGFAHVVQLVHASSRGLPLHTSTKHVELDEGQLGQYPPKRFRAQEQPTFNTEAARSHCPPPAELAEFSRRADEEADHRHGKSYNIEMHELSEDMTGHPNQAGWGPIPNEMFLKDNNVPDDQNTFTQIPRIPSRTQSEARPESRCSNQSRVMVRPVRPHDLISRAPSASPRHFAASKVTKPAGDPKESIVSTATRATAPKDKKKLMMSLMEYLTMGQNVLSACEEQQSLVDTQKDNIRELQHSSNIYKVQARALEAENAFLAQSAKKYDDVTLKYKNHMKEVVVAQKWLIAEAAKIQKGSCEILKAHKDELVLEKIQNAIQEAKDLKVEAEEFQKLSNRNKDLERENRQLSIVWKQKQKLEEVNEKLHQDNTGFKAALAIEAKTNESLKADVDRKAHNLACEARSKEQLEKQLEAQATFCRELVEQMKQLPSEISKQLQKEDGVLANIMNAENITTSKIDEVAALVTELRADQPETSASVAKVIEDLFSREQNSEAGQASFNEATAQTLGELKESVNQLCLDGDSKNRYNERISNLEKANGNLTADKTAREHEVQSLTRQLEEIRRELADCQNQLRDKEGELTTARAMPTEDPRLKARIQELESAKNGIETQLKAVNQEVSKAKDEVKAVRDGVARKDQQIKDFEQKLYNAQKLIKAFNGERDNYMATKEEENKLACRELAKKAESQKETIKVKLESQVNIAKQRYQEKESELGQTKQRLQEVQAQLEDQNYRASIQEDGRAEYIQKTKEQMAQVQQLIERVPSQKIPQKFLQELSSLKIATMEANSRLGLAVKQLPQILNAANQDQLRIETKIRNVGALEMDKYDLTETNSALQQKIDDLENVVARGALVMEKSGRESANTTPLLPALPQNMPRREDDIPHKSTARPAKSQPQKGMNMTPRNNFNMGTSEGTRYAAAGNARQKTSLQSSGTGQSSRIANSMATPQLRAIESSGSSKSVHPLSSQQPVSASKASEQSMKPFSALNSTSSSPLSDMEFAAMITSIGNEANEAAPVQTKLRATRHGTPAATLFSSKVPRESQQEHSSSWGDFKPESQKGRKSSLKTTKNPHINIETANIEAQSRKERTPSRHRPTLAVGRIPGFKGGKVVGPSNTTSQNNKQQAPDQTDKQKAPSLTPIARSEKYVQKRQHDGQDSNSAPKRRAPSKPRVHSKENSDFQDKRKAV